MMTENTVSQLPSENTVSQLAEEIGAALLNVSTCDERKPIYQYGMCLLAKAEPPASLTLRFHAAFTKLALRLPEYQTFTRDYVMFTGLVSLLQCCIAIFVARYDNESAVQS